MYKKLKKILSTRGHVLVKGDKNNYCKFSKTQSGGMVMGYDYCNKEEAKEYVCSFIVEKDVLNRKAKENNWKIIDVFDTPQERFKEGDKVVVTDGLLSGHIGTIESFDSFVHEVSVKDVKRTVFKTHNQLSYPFKEDKDHIAQES